MTLLRMFVRVISVMFLTMLVRMGTIVLMADDGDSDRDRDRAVETTILRRGELYCRGITTTLATAATNINVAIRLTIHDSQCSLSIVMMTQR
jgi:hypothetical protein